MQIDFHHAVTFVLARLAGFDSYKANTIAYSSQYVDDATNSGLIRFKNNFMYKRTSSAHPMVSLFNVKFVSSREAWVPFHFLPGAEGEGLHKTICRPNSVIAKEMVNACIASKEIDKDFSLHRLGISAHVYADTWAHQDFTGLNVSLNDVDKIICKEKKNWFRLSYRLKLIARLFGRAIGDLFPLGHGSVLTYPDLPYLKWSYVKPNAPEFTRDNTEIFLDACTHLYSFFKNYQNGDLRHTRHEIPLQDYGMLKKLFETIRDENADHRHEKWLGHIQNGNFSFGPESLTYFPKGRGSWKERALKRSESYDRWWHQYDYHDSFLKSDWKMFHDALQVHKVTVLHQILPKHGICVV